MVKNNLIEKIKPKYIYSKRARIIPFLWAILSGPFRNSKLFQKLKMNSISYQKDYWYQELMKSDSSQYQSAYRFDSPLCQDKNLGDYEKIKAEYFIPYIEGKRVLEIGCLGGKWSKYFFDKNALSVMLVDLDKKTETFLRDKFPKNDFQFYETKGYELYGVEDNSIDFVFSIDSLGRCPKKYIIKYLMEIGRILSNDGVVLLHLPCDESIGSVEKGFVSISKKEIEASCYRNNWNQFELDFDTITHGVLLKVNQKFDNKNL